MTQTGSQPPHLGDTGEEPRHQINRVQLTVNQGEAVLIRVVGVIQRRGFDVRWMDVRPTDNTLTEFVFTIDVQSERDIDLLTRQISRIHDVKQVRVLERDLDDVVEALEIAAMPGAIRASA